MTKDRRPIVVKPFAFDLNSIQFDHMEPDELAEYVTHAEIMLEYARTKRRAMLLRAAGRITSADLLETQCDALYECLPTNWQW